MLVVQAGLLFSSCAEVIIKYVQTAASFLTLHICKHSNTTFKKPTLQQPPINGGFNIVLTEDE